jgi:hypothetical protein
MRFLTTLLDRMPLLRLGRRPFQPKAVHWLLAAAMRHMWPMIVVAAATVAACGGEDSETITQPTLATATPQVTATATRQAVATTTPEAVATATPQPTATVGAGPSVGTHLSAASADGSVRFEILVASETTFELPSVVIRIDPQLSCGYEHSLLPVTVTMSPPDAGTISDAGLEFHGSQAMSIASQSADYQGNLLSTLEGSEGLTIDGKFTGAKGAEGVFRFTGGPVLNASFAPSGGGPAETVALTCDTGQISWTAK